MERELRAKLRAEYCALGGLFPRRVPLNPVILACEDCGAYTLEKVVFYTDIDTPVPCSLLLPRTDSGPVPVVVAVHPQEGEYGGLRLITARRSSPDACAYGSELAEKGFAVISIDMAGFGERRPPSDVRDRKPHMADGEFERFLFLKLLLEGTTLYARSVLDLMCAVDYVTTRPEVDPRRIGALGHGAGGRSVLHLMMHDQRIRAGVCSCGISTWDAVLRSDVYHEFSAYLPGMLSVGDYDVFVPLLAPRPLMLMAATDDDTYPIDGFRRIASGCARMYGLDGAADRFTPIEHDNGHAFTSEMRSEAYDFLTTWLS